jgi:hypothetical protein
VKFCSASRSLKGSRDRLRVGVGVGALDGEVVVERVVQIAELMVICTCVNLLSQRAERPRVGMYASVHIRYISRMPIQYPPPSSRHSSMSRPPRCAYRLTKTYLPCKRLHPSRPRRNHAHPSLLALKIRQSNRDSMPILLNPTRTPTKSPKLPFVPAQARSLLHASSNGCTDTRSG